MVSIFFSACYICVGFSADGVSCIGRTQYSAPGATTCSTVDAGYYTTGCDADGNNCTGQSQCTGTTYCTDGVQHECPDAGAHKRTTFPDNYYNPTITIMGIANNALPDDISKCQVLIWMQSARGRVYEYAYYNPVTSKYDNTNIYGWGAVSPGYYLTNKAGWGTYLYYHDVKECPSGAYCPGKDFVKYNPSTLDIDYTETFGLVPCPVGAYCPENSTAPTLCPKGTANPNTGAGGASACVPCTGATYSDSTGSATCTPCPTATNATDVVSYGYWDSAGHVVREGCYANFRGKDVPNGSMTTYHCYVDAGADSYGIDGSSRLCWTYVDRSELKCDGGYYNEQANSGSTNLPGFPTLEKLWNNACVAVGDGYWSGADAVTRTQCDTGLTTIGYGDGADEATDCGHILHVGTDRVYLRSVKKTSPSLAVGLGGATYYANMSAVKHNLTANSTRFLKSDYNDSIYYIYDDTAEQSSENK